MAQLTKKQKSFAGKVDSNKLYPLADALGLVKECACAKFDESIDVAVQLGIDAKKSDQVVRGAVVLPNGTGKTKRVAVFAQGAKAEEAKAAGADIVGMEDLAAMIKAGDMPFDIVIAAPDAMRIVGTLGQILGPRGLMPNPKVGTVTPDVATAVKNAKAGQVQFRVDKIQTSDKQGCLPAQSCRFLDNGRRCSRGLANYFCLMAKNSNHLQRWFEVVG